MSEVQRICPQCGKSSALQMRHCPHCGLYFDGGLPVPQESMLPATLTKAALPVLAGAASLALRAGWKLLQSRMAQATLQPAAPPVVKLPQAEPTQLPAQRPRRTIRIRSSWAIGDVNGQWRQGSSEHLIEFDD